MYDADAHHDRRWLVDTVTRISLRYGRALHDLSSLPGLIALARLWDLPEATDVQDAAQAIEDTVSAVIDELERVREYATAITDPGPATCKTCGTDIGIFSSLSRDWRHWRYTDDPNAPLGRRTEVFDPGHEPRPVWETPPRPDWRTDDTDLTPTTTHEPTTDAQSSEDPGGTRHQASPPGSLRKEHHP